MVGDGGGPRPDGLRKETLLLALLVVAGGGGRFPDGAGRGGEVLLVVAPGFFIFGGGADRLFSSESETHSPALPPEDEKSTRTLCPDRFTILPVFVGMEACWTATPGFASISCIIPIPSSRWRCFTLTATSHPTSPPVLPPSRPHPSARDHTAITAAGEVISSSWQRGCGQGGARPTEGERLGCLGANPNVRLRQERVGLSSNRRVRPRNHTVSTVLQVTNLWAVANSEFFWRRR